MKTSKIILFLALAVMIAYAVHAASSLTASIHVAVEHSQTLAGALGTPKDLSNINFQQAFTAGTSSAAAQVNTLYYGQRTLADGASESLDLYGGLTNNLGEVATFAHVKGIYLKNRSTTQTLVVGNGTNPFGTFVSPATATISIPPSGAVLFMGPLAGYTVTDSTGDNLKVLNGSAGTSTVYDIWLIGTSAP